MMNTASHRGLVMVNNTFAERLSAERSRRRMTQMQVVDELARRGQHLTQMGLSKMESGATKVPRHELLIALADLYGCSIDYLISGKEQAPPEQFVTLEANETARLLDSMNDEDLRCAVLTLTKTLATISRRRADLNVEFFELLRDTRPSAPSHLQIRFDSVLRDLHRSRSGGD